MSLFDQLDQLEKESSGGGGFIGKILFQIGYKLYIYNDGEFGNEDNFFPFKPGDDEDKDRALAAAKTFVVDNDSDKKPTMAIQFRLAIDTILGREVKWDQDQFYIHPTYTQMYKEIVRPALNEAEVSKTGEMWGRIAFAADPYKPTKESIVLDANGNEKTEVRPNLSGYLVEVYANKAEAEEAAGNSGGSPTGSSQYTTPSGWTADSWADTISDVLDELIGVARDETPDSAKKKAVASLFDISFKDVSTLLSEV